MPRLNPNWRGFSWRMRAVIFGTVCVLLMGQHYFLYRQSILAAYDETRRIIDAHEEELDEAMTRFGADYLRGLLHPGAGARHDPNLYLLLQDGDRLDGNLSAWPAGVSQQQNYAEIVLPRPESNPLHLLASVTDYAHGIRLLVGYDLQRVDQLRRDQPRAILENLALAFVISLLVSLVLTWLLARHFRQFNRACAQVMAGDLTARVRDNGTTDEFGSLAHNINAMLDWNGALIATIKDAGNAIAHDMRTPLSRLRLELMSLAEQPQLQARAKEQILEQAERIDGLTAMFDNILSIAHAEARSSTALFTALDLKQLVQDVLELYAPLFEEKSQRLTAELPAAAVMICGDRQLLGQALGNLLDNAGKYAPVRGAVRVTLTAQAGKAVLAVADDGPGIPETLREKVKERFFRLETDRHTPGHGLGLSLVNAAAVLHGGALELASNQPGLLAQLVLPLQE